MENNKKELMDAVLHLSNKMFKVRFYKEIENYELTEEIELIKEKELTYQELGIYLLTHEIKRIDII